MPRTSRPTQGSPEGKTHGMDATPYSAPQTASASAESSVLMNEPSSSRNMSWLAWARCSSSIRAWSILGLTVIVVSFFESVFADHSKDHPVAVAYFSSDTHTSDPYTTLLDSTRPGGQSPWSTRETNGADAPPGKEYRRKWYAVAGWSIEVVNPIRGPAMAVIDMSR